MSVSKVWFKAACRLIRNYMWVYGLECGYARALEELSDLWESIPENVWNWLWDYAAFQHELRYNTGEC